MCVIEGCNRKIYRKTRGWCRGHTNRFDKGWVVDVPLRQHRPFGYLSYVSAHDQIRKVRGPASARPCTECGQKAKDWSLDHDTTAEIKIDTWSAMSGMSYSLNPYSYSARCRRCHVAYDAEFGLTKGKPGRPRVRP